MFQTTEHTLSFAERAAAHNRSVEMAEDLAAETLPGCPEINEQIVALKQLLTDTTEHSYFFRERASGTRRNPAKCRAANQPTYCPLGTEISRKPSRHEKKDRSTLPMAVASRNNAAHPAITNALAELARNNPQQTRGGWLEATTVAAGPHIKEWDIAACWAWADWPEREECFPRATGQDIGIDAVATRRSDGRHIAVQCKARQLDDNGRGADIAKSELDKFAAARVEVLVGNGNACIP